MMAYQVFLLCGMNKKEETVGYQARLPWLQDMIHLG
jgi:hypothetical protein